MPNTPQLFMKFKVLAISFIAIAMVLVSKVGDARSQYLGFWQNTYPNSTSLNNPGNGCQLCHSRESGGNGWNYYGWSIRQELNGSTSVTSSVLTNAIQFLEANTAQDPGCDLSGPSNGVTFLDKIRYNAQPGWTTGSVNNDRRRNGNCFDNISPPVYQASDRTTVDFPSAEPEISDPFPTQITSGGLSVDLTLVAEQFVSPVNVVRAPNIDASLFVVEQRGRIWRVELATGNKTLFYDVGPSLVSARPDFDERGLLGLVFHPNFEANGLFYTYQSEPVRTSQNSLVDYTTLRPNQTPDHRTFIVEHQASDSSCNSSITRRRNLLVIDQPSFNHNGGDLAFDASGALYIGLGDGGGADDRGFGHVDIGNSQDTSTPLGSILRILPNGSDSPNGQYGIHPDNPFGGLDEIFAYGLRNPYRFSFDNTTGELYVGDVGQNQVEEINRVVVGGNYGWNSKEGEFFFYTTDGDDGTYISRQAPAGAPNDLIDPIAQYDHGEGLSVTGGYVYRGSSIQGLIGNYVFADFSRGFANNDGGRLFTFNPSVPAAAIQEFANANTVLPNVRYTGFGEDVNNELYVVANETNTFNPSQVAGRLYRLTGSGVAPSFPVNSEESAVCEDSAELCFPILGANGAASVICL